MGGVDVKQLARRVMVEVYGGGQVGLLDEVCAPGYVFHDALTGDCNLELTKESVRLLHAAFPDVRLTAVTAYADGDNAIVRWTMAGTHERPLLGIPASGRRVLLEGISIFRFVDGQLAEEWVQWNTFGFLQQLGVTLSVWRFERPELALS